MHLRVLTPSFALSLILGCSSDPAPATVDAAADTAVDATSDTAAEAAPGDGDGDGACPATMPEIGGACSFVGDNTFSTTPTCKFQDPTAPVGSHCPWFLSCVEGHAYSAGIETIAIGCPGSVPTEGASCTCGGHVFGESTGGQCEYPCDGGVIVARCDLGGKLSPDAPGSVHWSVSACTPHDAGTD